MLEGARLSSCTIKFFRKRVSKDLTGDVENTDNEDCLIVGVEDKCELGSWQ